MNAWIWTSAAVGLFVLGGTLGWIVRSGRRAAALDELPAGILLALVLAIAAVEYGIHHLVAKRPATASQDAGRRHCPLKSNLATRLLRPALRRARAA